MDIPQNNETRVDEDKTEVCQQSRNDVVFIVIGASILMICVAAGLLIGGTAGIKIVEAYGDDKWTSWLWSFVIGLFLFLICLLIGFRVNEWLGDGRRRLEKALGGVIGGVIGVVIFVRMIELFSGYLGFAISFMTGMAIFTICGRMHECKEVGWGVTCGVIGMLLGLVIGWIRIGGERAWWIGVIGGVLGLLVMQEE